MLLAISDTTIVQIDDLKCANLSIENGIPTLRISFGDNEIGNSNRAVRQPLICTGKTAEQLFASIRRGGRDTMAGYQPDVEPSLSSSPPCP